METEILINRSIAPLVQPMGDIDIYQAKTRLMNNGLPIHYIDSGVQPLIAIEWHYAIPRDPEASVALPGLAFKMLMEGTKEHSGNSWAEALAYLGAFPEVSSNARHGSLVVYTLKKHFEQVASLMYEALYHPELPEKALEKLKNIARQSLEINALKTGFQAQQIFKKNLYGQKHHLGKVNTIESTSAISLESIQEYYRSHILENGFSTIMAGLVEENEIMTFENKFGTKDLHFNMFEEEPVAETMHQTHTFNMPESKQSTIRMGFKTISMEHPDYPALKIANEVLGGYFGSRLMKNIREEKGYTYGIYSQVASQKDHALFVVSSDVKKEKTSEAIDEIKLEMKKLREEPISDYELETVKNYMLGTLLNSLNTPFALADKFKAIHFNGQNYGYFDRYMAEIKNINSEKILQICQSYLNPEAMLEVVAGERQ